MKKSHELSIAVYSGASFIDDNGQIGLLAGVRIGDLTGGASFHNLLRLSNKSRSPVKRLPATNILAESKVIEGEKCFQLVIQSYLVQNINYI